jgi:cytochrome c oxidase cbb3-type subunit I/II
VWDKVKEDPILKMFVVGLTAYGMSTFEGPMLSLKNLNAFAHYTDWIVAHVHVGALGWNGFITFGMLYWMMPRLFNTNLYSVKWANTHFIIGTLGILLYAIPMYWAAFSQALMWKTFTPEGQLKYQFLETVTRIIPMYIFRGIGGLLYLGGVILMVVNIWKTVKQGKLVEREENEAPSLKALPVPAGKEYWHSIIERRPIQLLVFSLVAVGIGGAVEIIPTFLVDSNVPTISTVKPYTPLELQGRDIYIQEGCYTCHSQMIRPFRDEVARYGDYSKSGEFIYDFPFQWGSKRTGPDLARIGGKYPDSWHYRHMADPEEISQGSIMPPYPWMLDKDVDTSTTASKIRTMIALGVPYDEGYDQKANQDYMAQANKVVESLRKDRIETEPTREIVALIAYLQRMGTDIKKASAEELVDIH